MTPQWENFWLDMILVIAWASQGFLHIGDLSVRDWRLRAIGVLYFLGAISVIAIMAGDFALALGFTQQDYWWLNREYRVVRWRYGLVGTQFLIAIINRFGWRRRG
jgi:hypothetical protein